MGPGPDGVCQLRAGSKITWHFRISDSRHLWPIQMAKNIEISRYSYSFSPFGSAKPDIKLSAKNANLFLTRPLRAIILKSKSGLWMILKIGKVLYPVPYIKIVAGSPIEYKGFFTGSVSMAENHDIRPIAASLPGKLFIREGTCRMLFSPVHPRPAVDHFLYPFGPHRP